MDANWCIVSYKDWEYQLCRYSWHWRIQRDLNTWLHYTFIVLILSVLSSPSSSPHPFPFLLCYFFLSSLLTFSNFCLFTLLSSSELSVALFIVKEIEKKAEHLHQVLDNRKRIFIDKQNSQRIEGNQMQIWNFLSLTYRNMYII